MNISLQFSNTKYKDYAKQFYSTSLVVAQKISVLASKVFIDLAKLLTNPVFLGAFVITAFFAPKIFIIGLLSTLFVLSIKNLPSLK